KNGSRFHFEMPGSVQGFAVDSNNETQDGVILENVAGHSAIGTRSLAIRYRHLAKGHSPRATTLTFIPPEDMNLIGYSLDASPTLYPCQTVRAGFVADASNTTPVECHLVLQYYGADDRLVPLGDKPARIGPGESARAEWRIPATGGAPIAKIGLEIT